MVAYRVYCLDGAGHISLADWIEAKDDDQAIAGARKVRPEAHKCEIWDKKRLVARLNGSGHFQRVSP